MNPPRSCPRIQFIMVSYPDASRALQNVEALTDHGLYGTIVVNTTRCASTSSPPLGVRVVNGHGNVGYGSAVNLGARDHLAPGTQWIIVSNDDCRPSTLAVEWLVRKSESTTADILAFHYVDAAGRNARSYGTEPSLRSLFATLALGESRAASVSHRRVPKGAFFAIRRSTFEALGGFDPRFFLYYEEVDLFVRAARAGSTVEWAPSESAVYHEGGAASREASHSTSASLGSSMYLYTRKHARPFPYRSGMHVMMCAILLRAWAWSLVHTRSTPPFLYRVAFAAYVRSLLAGEAYDGGGELQVVPGRDRVRKYSMTASA
jgi:GT2 family glycosyltransferase